MSPPGARECFCCGEDNPDGLHLAYSYPAPGEAETSLIVPRRFSGPPGRAHGGFLSMILDETMAHACRSGAGGGDSGFTAALEVRFRNPIRVATRITVSARIREVRGRIVEVEGLVRDENSVVAATGTAKFLAG